MTDAIYKMETGREKETSAICDRSLRGCGRADSGGGCGGDLREIAERSINDAGVEILH